LFFFVLDRVHKRTRLTDEPLFSLPVFFFFLLAHEQSSDTLDKVRGIISEQLGTDLDAVAADSKFVDLGADSLDTVEIMMALEEQFEITLDEEGAEKIGTVQEAADMIQAQIDA
jgi:acyl carrier protein